MKKNLFITILLCAVTLTFVTGCGTDNKKEETKKENEIKEEQKNENVTSNTNTTQYNISTMKGSYLGVIDTKNGEGEAIKIECYFNFYEDGTFEYRRVLPGASGTIKYGSYVIDNDNITIYNKLISTGSTFEVDNTKEVIKIDSKDSLTVEDATGTLTLKKQESTNDFTANNEYNKLLKEMNK